MKSLVAQEIKLLCSNQKNRMLFLVWCSILIAFVLYNNEAYSNYIEGTRTTTEDVKKLELAQADLLYGESAQTIYGLSQQQCEMIQEGYEALYGEMIHTSEAFEEQDRTQLLQSAEGHVQSLDKLNEAYGIYNEAAYDKEMIASVQAFRDYSNAYYQRLEQSGNEFWEYNDMTGFNFLYRFLAEVFPIAGTILLFLILSDHIAGEKERGTIKIKLLLPFSRGQLIRAKWLGGMVYTVGFLFLPVMGMFLILCGIRGSGSPDYLVLADTMGARTTEEIEGKIVELDMESCNMPLDTLDQTMAGSHCIGISKYLVSKEYDAATAQEIPMPDARLSLQKIWVFLLFALVYELLVIIWGTTATTWLSFQCNRKGIALAVGAGIGIAVGMLQSSYGFLNAVRILGGTAGVTVLTGAIILVLSGLIPGGLLVIGARKQNIVC